MRPLGSYRSLASCITIVFLTHLFKRIDLPGKVSELALILATHVLARPSQVNGFAESRLTRADRALFLKDLALSLSLLLKLKKFQPLSQDPQVQPLTSL